MFSSSCVLLLSIRELFFLESTDASSTVTVGDLEVTPVSATIARHLGIDLSPEGKMARSRFGIAVVIHGSPNSGGPNFRKLLYYLISIFLQSEKTAMRIKV